ncbi:hypothetical protein ASC80_01625 [Afipia sp. Root123D2]|nr:hypothetical protein ASC80_01625 [Afipia sp. Root123D2]
MTAQDPVRPLDLAKRLVLIGEGLAENRRTQISDASIRVLREQVADMRMDIRNEQTLIGYEATCLVECIAELAFARTDQDANRESRAICYVNSLTGFMRGDVMRAEKALS